MQGVVFGIDGGRGVTEDGRSGASCSNQLLTKNLNTHHCKGELT